MEELDAKTNYRPRVAAKLALSFGLLIALVTVVDWIALRQISRADAALDSVVDERWERVELARETLATSSLNGRIILQVFIADNQDEMKDLLGQAATNSERISEMIDQLRAKSDSDEERNLLDAIETKRQGYLAGYSRAFDLLAQKHNSVEARSLMMHEVAAKLNDYHQAMDDYVQYQGRLLDKAQDANVNTNLKVRRQALLLISFATFLAVIIAILITIYTATQLRRRIHAEEELRKAQHDLEDKVKARTAALGQSEQRYRLLFESNPQPMWVFDAETLAFLAVNDAAVRCYGYSREEFLQMTIKDIRPPQEIESLFTRSAKIIDGFGSYDLQPWLHRRRDGSIIEVDISWHDIDFAGRPARLVLAQDVTERRRAEAEAVFQQTRFQQLFENAPLGIVRLDQNDRIVDANKEFERIFQFSLDEIKNRCINEVIVPADLEAEAISFSTNTLGGHAVNGEALRQRKDQTLIPVHILGVPIIIDAKPVGVFAIYIDMSERAKAELERVKLTAEIESQRKRLNDILETIPCVVWEADFDSSGNRARFVNSHVEKMYGYSVEEWLSTPNIWFSTVHPDDQALAKKGDVELMAQGRVRNELRRRTKDGRTVWGENQIVLTRDARGKPVGVRGVTTDITERKEAETALRSSERKYRDIFTFAPVGIYQSLPDGTIVGANHALVEMLGYESVADLMERKMDRDVYADESMLETLINEYAKRGYARDLQVQWKKKDGTPVWIELTAHTIRGSSTATEYFEGFIHDITQRKRIEDERQVISEIIQGVTNTTDLNELLALVHQSIARYLYAENCFVALYDETTGLMEFLSGSTNLIHALSLARSASDLAVMCCAPVSRFQ